MSSPNPNQLVVEGTEDLYAIISLMGKHIEWPNQKEKAPVQLYAAGGIDKILDRDNIASRLKASGLMRLGFVVDADVSCNSRWESIRNYLLEHFDDYPDELNPNGSIYVSSNGLRIGVWVMPDNGSEGMLESLLSQLVSPDHLDVLNYAKEVVVGAREMGAPCREVHIDKSVIHTWLAWQDPPGQALGNAVLHSMIDGKNPVADTFVNWFINLYELS